MLDALTLDQMRTFVTVAEAGSFRSGAARLKRAQSAVSNAVANLEGQLGVSLFDRSGHRPTLTDEGTALLANVRDILLRVDAMRARARSLSRGLELELSVTVDSLFPIAKVGAALRHVQSVYPAVGLRAAVESLGGPVAALIEKRTTLAILVGEDFRDPRIDLEAISAIDQVAVVAAAHPLTALRGSDHVDLSAIRDHLQIVTADPTPLSQGRSFGVLSQQVCRVSTQEAKHALILAGLGWGRLPVWQIERDLAEGRLVHLATKALGRGSRLSTEAYIGRRLDEPFGPAASAFREALLRLM